MHGMDAYETPCYRALDTPLQILGLELSDWILVIVSLGVCLIAGVVLNLVVLLALPLAIWVALLRLRRGGKPAGYLRYLCYRSGAIYLLKGLLPEAFPQPYLVPPVWALGEKRTLFLSAHRSEAGQGGSFIRFFLANRKWIQHCRRQEP